MMINGPEQNYGRFLQPQDGDSKFGSDAYGDSDDDYNDEDEALPIQPMRKKRRADDDLTSIPQVESSIKPLDGRVTLFTGKGDRAVIKLDKEQPAVVVACEEIQIPAGSRVLIINANEGYIGVALGCLHLDSEFLLHDSHLGNAELIQRNVDANVGICRNLRVLDEAQLDALETTDSVDVIVYHPGGFTSLELIEDRIAFGAHLLKEGGSFYLISHKKAGADRHFKMLQTTLGDNAEVIGRGGGGFRVFMAKKTQAVAQESRSIQRTITYQVLDQSLSVSTEPSLFSKDGLDIGTRFLLETVGRDQLLSFERLLDIGCGWGAIGITAASINQTGEVVMTDIDTRAVRLAQENANRLNLQDRVSAVATTDIKVIPGNFDLMLSNPPFHADTPELMQLFTGMRDKLAKKGQLYFVVEKTYLKKLTDIAQNVFGKVTVVAEDPNIKFSVLSVRK
jgi:16S rRNA (guanine1207-N2)-methyltransferase